MYAEDEQEAESLLRLSNKIAELFREERCWDTARVCALLSAKSIAWMYDEHENAKRDDMLEGMFNFMRENCNRNLTGAVFHTEH
jgi:hypothetical protein